MPITVIELPHVGESVTEGLISRWLKRPGDQVEKYDPLLEVVTDKVSMEVPSPYTGRLVKLLVEEGDTVPMGQPIAEMEISESEETQPTPALAASAPPVSPSPTSASAQAPAEPAARPSPRTFEFLDTVRSVGPTGSGEGGQGRPDALLEQHGGHGDPANPSSTSATAGRQPGASLSDRATGRRPFLSPLVRRLVAQHGVDVTQLRGTGFGGRITKQDVLRYVEARDSAEPAPQATPRASSTVDTEVLPLTALRRTIAEHMARSSREIPAAWTMVEADVTGLVRWREAHREAFQRTHGVPLTYLPAAAHVVAQALRDNPRLNARWDRDRILLHRRVNLGIAVSTDAGLIVPVVHDADTLSVAGLAKRIAELAAAARSQSLRLEDVQGGTFTLNNTGALGSVVSVPIINHPQAAILTTEAIVKRPVVVEGDVIAVRSIMALCLTFDHRIIDGAEAARFLQGVKSRLEAIDERTPLL